MLFKYFAELDFIECLKAHKEAIENKSDSDAPPESNDVGKQTKLSKRSRARGGHLQASAKGQLDGSFYQRPKQKQVVP